MPDPTTSAKDSHVIALLQNFLTDSLDSTEVPAASRKVNWRPGDGNEVTDKFR
jgi:hypothetical protein